MTPFQRLKTTALCGIIATLATSCGNYMGGGGKGIRVSTSGVSYGATADLSGISGQGTSTKGKYTCPNTANVISNGDAQYTNAGKYTVCTHPSNAANIAVHGNTMGASGICVFPLQYVDSQHVYFKPDLSTGLPMAYCASLSTADPTNGLEMAFAGINYNAVIVVDDTSKNPMQLCLANSSPGSCPIYSYGKFR